MIKNFRFQNKEFSSRTLILGVSAVLILLAAFVFFKRVDENYPWIWNFTAQKFLPQEKKPAGPRHILFLFVDHFEPHDPSVLRRWNESYPALAKKHADADGKHPQHTWFWYFDKSDGAEKRSFLGQLSNLAYQDLGEVELHLHHWNDTEETFLKKVNDMIGLSNQYGAMITAEPRPRPAFGFIHGLWGLDNSRGAGACGINNELILLRQAGCYADFTHPSWGRMHPRRVNTIYYAIDNPKKPKSYDTGQPMEAGKPGIGDLLIFEGPSAVSFDHWRPAYDHGDITHASVPSAARIDRWIRADVHVKGRPEWIFVKVFTHGAIAEDHDAILGDTADKMYRYLEEKYNDGRQFILHYVTAREAYNIAKAAEAGRTGNPNDYRNFVIPPYVNHFVTASVPFETIGFSDDQAVLRFLANPGDLVKVSLRSESALVTGEANVREMSLLPGQTSIMFVLKGRGVVGFARNLTTPRNQGIAEIRPGGKISRPRILNVSTAPRMDP